MRRLAIVVAADSFKGGLSAPEACRAIAEGLRDANPEVEVRLKPMADGGEGTAAALLSARPGGAWVSARVAGPLPERAVDASFAWFPDDRTAVVEMAAANGLPLLAEQERNPLVTSTLGTGQLIAAAIRRGARRIVLAIGGSATVDGGVGAATALGWKFLNGNGIQVPPGGGHLRQIARIVPFCGPALPPVTVLCDVTNPLCGPRGAAEVFGPQKGATPAMVAHLEAGLAHLADCVRTQLGKDVLALAGGGAAGGLGAGAVAFFDAELKPGIATVLEVSRFDSALRGADWCLTGEGSFDRQSLDGKVVSGVAAAARAAGVPVVVLAGRIRATVDEYRPHGIHAAIATHDPMMPLDEVLRCEYELLRTTAARWLRSVEKTVRDAGRRTERMSAILEAPVNVLAIDVGGTKFSMALIREGRIVRRDSQRTDRAGGRDWMLARLVETAQAWRSDATFAACGVGFGGPVDFARQRIACSTHVGGWSDFELSAYLREALDVPVLADNDANVGALGEQLHGAGRGCDPLLYVTVSTGIGGGVIVDGKVLRGADSFAGEIGHLTVRPDGPECLCGARGCLERLCSGLWLERDNGRPPRELMADPAFVARYVVDLALGLKSAIMLLNPARIVLGGGISKDGERLFVPLRAELGRQMTAWSRARIDVVQAALGDDSVLYGAYELARSASSFAPRAR